MHYAESLGIGSGGNHAIDTSFNPYMVLAIELVLLLTCTQLHYTSHVSSLVMQCSRIMQVAHSQQAIRIMVQIAT